MPFPLSPARHGLQSRIHHHVTHLLRDWNGYSPVPAGLGGDVPVKGRWHWVHSNWPHVSSTRFFQVKAAAWLLWLDSETKSFSHVSWSISNSLRRMFQTFPTMTGFPYKEPDLASVHGIYLCIIRVITCNIGWWDIMQKVSEKKTYEKPMLEVCGSLVEQTLKACPEGARCISGQCWCPVPDVIGWRFLWYILYFKFVIL